MSLLVGAMCESANTAMADYYNEIKSRYGNLDSKQKLSILHAEMSRHIEALRHFTGLLQNIDRSVWQPLMSECADNIDKFPEKIDSIQALLAEKYTNDGLLPHEKLEGLNHYIPSGPFGFLMGNAHVLEEIAKEKSIPGLPIEAAQWLGGISETIMKMRVLTYALLGKRW